jgi:hypothetical protein
MTMSGDINYTDNKGGKYSIPGNIRFDSYKGVFKNLINRNKIITMYPIVSMIITYDSTRAITVTKADDWTSYVKMYCLKDY